MTVNTQLWVTCQTLGYNTRASNVSVWDLNSLSASAREVDAQGDLLPDPTDSHLYTFVVLGCAKIGAVRECVGHLQHPQLLPAALSMRRRKVSPFANGVSLASAFRFALLLFVARSVAPPRPRRPNSRLRAWCAPPAPCRRQGAGGAPPPTAGWSRGARAVCGLEGRCRCITRCITRRGARGACPVAAGGPALLFWVYFG